MMEKLKARWGVTTHWELAIIFLVFSLAGSSILYVKRPMMRLLGIPPDVSLWIRIPLTIAIYQVTLLAWGTLFGHFRFFWEKEKKFMRLLVRAFFPVHTPMAKPEKKKAA